MNLKNFTEEQLLLRIKNYYDRTDALMDNMGAYFKNKSEEKERQIRQEYKALKQELNEEYTYFSAVKNDITEISRVHSCYQYGVQEAAAHGFRIKINGKINREMYNSVEEAHYRLEKYVSDLDEWQEL